MFEDLTREKGMEYVVDVVAELMDEAFWWYGSSGEEQAKALHDFFDWPNCEKVMSRINAMSGKRNVMTRNHPRWNDFLGILIDLCDEDVCTSLRWQLSMELTDDALEHFQGVDCDGSIRRFQKRGVMSDYGMFLRYADCYEKRSNAVGAIQGDEGADAGDSTLPPVPQV